MAENTKIEWTDHTFNPWMGCTKVSPGCDRCYAEQSTPVRILRARGFETWGPDGSRYRSNVWDNPPRWNRRHAAFFAQHGRRQRVFCASLADWLDNEVPIEWLVDLLDLIRCTPELDWLLLSKRIGNWRKRLEEARVEARCANRADLHRWVAEWLGGTAPANVWLGATVVNQAEADRDVPKLLAVPARVRFLSIEPMLGAITLPLTGCDNGSLPGPGGAGGVMCPDCGGALGGCRRLHWVICGGESGPKARPMHPDWARSLRDQCAAAGVPFLFKQWGEWAQAEAVPEDDDRKLAERWMRRDGSEPAGEVDFFGGDEALYKVGKAHALRTLDGREHNGFPEVQHATA